MNMLEKAGFTLEDGSFNDLDLYVKEGVAAIVMSKFKADKKEFRVASNHLDVRLIEELMLAFDHCERSLAIKSVVLTSAHKVAFSRGAKIELLLKSTDEQIRGFIELGHGMIKRIQNFPKPVVAALNGFALGGGLELAMACDYRVSSTRENAVFGLPEAHLGLIPAWGGTQNLPALVGVEQAKEIISKGRMDITAAIGKEMGLVDDLCEPEDLMGKAFSLAAQPNLARRSHPISGEAGKSPETIRKEIVDYLSTHPLSDPATIEVAPCAEAMGNFLVEHWDKDNIMKGLAYELEAFSYLQHTEDCHEGVQALADERPPKFKGR